MTTSTQSNPHRLSAASDPSRIVAPAAWTAIGLSLAAIAMLASLHVLSPEFAPSWRMISEYALGRYGWVLSLMFLAFGAGPWALAAAIRSQVLTRAGRVGLVFLVISGFGGAMASVFDIRHELGHGIAGLLGVLGFPIAALLLSASLRRNETWRDVARGLVWLANLTWVAVVLLVGTLVLMTMQMSGANGGHLPQHAPKVLPPGVFALAGWADRLIVVSNCAWVLWAAFQALALRRNAGVHRNSAA
jgi:hypothetical protein